MKTKALKLPDGGSVDIPIPAEFGVPILALNEASPADLAAGRKIGKWFLIGGVILGAVGIWMLITDHKRNASG